jgi:hypothetical protein
MLDELIIVENSVEEILIDLMVERVISIEAQDSLTKGVQASPSTSRESEPS